MDEYIISPFLAGLSVGLFCLGYCVPFVAPFMVAEGRSGKKDVSVILKFIFGRFLGYVLFGAVVGFVGERFQGDMMNFAMSAAMMVLSLTIIIYGLGLLNAGRFKFCAAISKQAGGFPLLMGFLMGFNLCPPFLMSVFYVATLHSVLKGVVYFIFFFIGTSLYFLPLFFLTFLNRLKEFQLVGRISAIVVGALFFIYSVYNMLKGSGVAHFSAR